MEFIALGRDFLYLNWDSCMKSVLVRHEMSDGKKTGEPVWTWSVIWPFCMYNGDF